MPLPCINCALLALATARIAILNANISEYSKLIPNKTYSVVCIEVESIIALIIFRDTQRNAHFSRLNRVNSASIGIIRRTAGDTILWIMLIQIYSFYIRCVPRSHEEACLQDMFGLWASKLARTPETDWWVGLRPWGRRERQGWSYKTSFW